MADDDQAGILDTLLTPLTLPRRAAKDLEAIGTAARSLPSFERVLLEQLDDLGADVRDLMEGLDRRVAALQLEVAQLNRDLAATRGHAAQLDEQVTDAVEHLPDLDARGPIARARDAITGSPEPSEQG